MVTHSITDDVRSASVDLLFYWYLQVSTNSVAVGSNGYAIFDLQKTIPPCTVCLIYMITFYHPKLQSRRLAKSIRNIICSVILLGGLAPAAGAVESLQITVNVTIYTLTLEWENGGDAARDWVLNAVWNDTYDTNTHGTSTGVGALTGALGHYNVINLSYAPVDITRTVADGTWTLQATNNTLNYCILRDDVDGAGFGAALATTGAVIRTALPDYNAMSYDLQITTPTAASSSATTSGNITVTLTATISP